MMPMPGTVRGDGRRLNEYGHHCGTVRGKRGTATIEADGPLLLARLVKELEASGVEVEYDTAEIIRPIAVQTGDEMFFYPWGTYVLGWATPDE